MELWEEYKACRQKWIQDTVKKRERVKACHVETQTRDQGGDPRVL